MMFVAIHELAHIASNGIGHDKEFYENFKWLLEEANQIGIYKRENFNDKPQMYCGINITNELI
jgi:predicted metal-dependent hydrolase